MKNFQMFIPVEPHILRMMNDINDYGSCLIVGGSIRDAVMGRSSKDIDIECYGVDGDVLENILKKSGGIVRTAGKHFGVFKVYFPKNGETVDVSLARRENKVGKGHDGFRVMPDPQMTLEEAAARRDFTINCFAYDPFTSTVYDPFGGEDDIKRSILRYVSEAFREDSLRVLRGMRFAGQFGFSMENDTANMCFDLMQEYDTISKERIWTEWEGFFAKATLPHAGMKVLEDTRWISLYPEIEAMVDLQQDPIWHPEGDCWTHTKHVMDEAVRIANRDALSREDRVILVLAALCHDMGKPMTTYVREDGRIASPQHAKEGVVPARSFMKSIGTPDTIMNKVEKLVQEHMIIAGVPKLTDRAVLRLAERVSPSNIDMLVKIIEADESGRPPLPKATIPYELEEQARRLAVREAPMRPYVMGRDILPYGVPAGREIGEIIQHSLEAQEEGIITDHDTGMIWLDQYMKERKEA